MLRFAAFVWAILAPLSAVAASPLYTLLPTSHSSPAYTVLSVSGSSPIYVLPQYQGPGDLVPSAAMWWGLRAYNAVAANSGVEAINIRRASDNATTDIAVLANGSMNVAAASSFCAATSCFLTEAYDQSGNLVHVTQGIAARQPALTFSCLGSAPCITSAFHASIQELFSASSVATWATGTYSGVAVRTSNFTSYSAVVQDQNNNGLAFNFLANSVNVGQGGSNVASPTTVPDSAWHVMTGVSDATASNGSKIVADNSATAGTLAASTIGAPNMYFAALDGSAMEAGFWPTVWTSTQWTPICHNAFVAWGTSVSC